MNFFLRIVQPYTCNTYWRRRCTEPDLSGRVHRAPSASALILGLPVAAADGWRCDSEPVGPGPVY